jgi:hypothetical protein
VIVKSNGSKGQKTSFDVFGARGNADNWARDYKKSNSYLNSITLSGYTGHEQPDEMSLVNIGGRIYEL